MSNLDKLISLFEKFPGIGARQARRFAFHILTMHESDTAELSRLIANLQASVVECTSCHRFFATQNGDICSICSSANRDHSRLLVVERDSDVAAIERAGVYDGLYFVLGGTVPLLNNKSTDKLRAGALKATVAKRQAEQSLTEVILGFSINPDGENTARFVESVLKEMIEAGLTLSHLGRGLSTGSELEYADPETIKNALQNRA